MRSVVALESRRAQASASLMITSATVLVLMICANGSAFSSWGGTALCFFLAGRSIGEGFGWFLGKGEKWALCTCTSSFPPTLIPVSLLDLRGVTPSESTSILLFLTGLSFQGPASSCVSLQVPRKCLKILDCTFQIPHHRIDVPLCYIWSMDW